MDNKIFELIITPFKTKFKKFQTNSLTEKLEFIHEIIETYETYLTEMFYLNRSPLIDTSNNNKQYIRDMKQSIATLLLKTSNTPDKSVPADLQNFSRILLGIAYEYGLFDLVVNHDMAIGLYESVSRTKTEYRYRGLALYREALCFEKGIGTRIKRYKAVEYYRMAAKLGDRKAQHVYGSIVFYGFFNQPPDHSEASSYLKQSALKATRTYPYAYFDLGVLYELSADLKDTDYAVECYKKGADLGCKNCSFKLAKAYELGDLKLKSDRLKSIFYYKQSKHGDAYLQMANYRFEGELMGRNKPEGYKLALKAIVNGNILGFELLGDLFEKGIGVKRSLGQSLWWYEIALSHGLNVKDKVKRLKIMLSSKS